MWYLIASIPDLCTLTYFYSVIDFNNYNSEETIRVCVLGGGLVKIKIDKDKEVLFNVAYNVTDNISS